MAIESLVALCGGQTTQCELIYYAFALYTDNVFIMAVEITDISQNKPTKTQSIITEGRMD